MRRYDPLYGNTLEETGYSGPIRSKTPKLKRLPYSRSLANEQPVEMEGEGLLGKVKNIVTWLIPGWFSSPQRARTLQTLDIQPSLSRSSTANFTPSPTQDTREGKACGGHQHEDDVAMAVAVSPDDIIRGILTGERVRERSIIYSRLAQYFRQRKGSLLSREEFEKLSMLIQKQGITKRPFRREQAATPRRAPSISAMSKMTDVDSHLEATPRPIVQAAKLSREFPKPLLRKSRVFSARFDEIDEAELSFANRQSALRSALSGISACPAPVTSSYCDLANKDSAGKVSWEKGEVERATKPFEFVIPLATNGSARTEIAEPPKPKLIFDFGPLESDSKAAGASAVRTAEAPSLISFTEHQAPKAEAPFKFTLPTGEGSKDGASKAEGKPSAFQFNLQPSGASNTLSFNPPDAKQPTSLATQSTPLPGGDKPASAIDSNGPPEFSFPAASSSGQPSFSFPKALESHTANPAASTTEPEQSKKTTVRPPFKFEPSVSLTPQTGEKPLSLAFGAAPASEGVVDAGKGPSKHLGFAFGSLASKAESGNDIKSSTPFSFGSFPAAPFAKNDNKEADSTTPKFSFGFTSTAPTTQPSVAASTPKFSFGAGMTTTASPLAVPGIMNEAAPSLLFNCMASPAKSPEPAPRSPCGSMPAFGTSTDSNAPLSSLGKQAPITAGRGTGESNVSANGSDDMMMEAPAAKRPLGEGFSFGAGASSGTLGSTFGSESTFGKAPGGGFNFGSQPTATATATTTGATTNSFEAPKAFGATGFGGSSTTQSTPFGNLSSTVASNNTSFLQMDPKTPFNFNFGGAETSSQSAPFTFGAAPTGDGSAGGFSVGATAPASGRKFSVPKRRPK